VAIASSTGGPAAVHRLLSELPGDFPAPILVVQHIARGFLAGFAAWLNDASALHVAVARDGEPLESGRVYVAPEDRHLGVSPQLTAVASGGPPIGGFRPAATHLFASLAGLGGSGVAVLLTGMGADGVEGLHALRRAGGRVLVQDEESSVVFGMPGAAIAAGLATEVLPLGRIAARLIDLTGEG
jgi:two-component system chemotaxis response regulator CheB